MENKIKLTMGLIITIIIGLIIWDIKKNLKIVYEKWNIYYRWKINLLAYVPF